MNAGNYLHSGDFKLESGKVLKDIEIAYNTLGTLNDDKSNVVWFCHSLTSDSDVQAWWPALVGEGKLYNPEEHFIICANYIGSCYGSTGPLSVNKETNKPYYHDFPNLSVRDLAAALDLLRLHLDLAQVHTLVGGSLGGQVAIEWTVQQPQVFENAIILASNAKNSPWAIALNETQRMAITADQTWKERSPDAGLAGLRAARALAVLSYRAYDTYKETQTDKEDALWEYRAVSYQNYQGDKFIKRFNTFSYWILSKVMDSHDVGRGRGGVAQALSKVASNVLVVGIDSDNLFPDRESRELASLLPNASYHQLQSLYGHDGFLIEFDKLKKLINEFYLKKSKTGKPFFKRMAEKVKYTVAAAF